MGLPVLLVGRLRPDLGVVGRLDGLPVADIRHVGAVQSAVAEVGGPTGALLVVCQTLDVPDVRHALAQISVAVPRVITLLEPLPGPPLAVAVGGALVAGTSSGPAWQLATLDRLRAEMWSAVWLPKVSKLAHPAPTLVQHARSWLPGSGFLAVHDGSPRVVSAPRAPLPGLKAAPAGALLAVAESGTPSWVRESLAGQTAPLTSSEFRSWRNPIDAFGAPEAGEFALLPDSLLKANPSDEAYGDECRGCGWRQPRTVCPFCGMAGDASKRANTMEVPLK